jgi:hypothetical protein
VPQQTWEWTRRIYVPPGRFASLHFGRELWKWDVSRYDGAATIAVALTDVGRSVDDDLIVSDAVRSLLPDVLDAVGGIESAYLRLKQALVAAQAISEQAAFQFPECEQVDISDLSTESAWYALEEMLVWARTLGDRLQRRSKTRGFDQGLIPALADGPLRNGAINARSRFLNDGLHEACLLAQLNLHMQSSQPGSKMASLRAGRVILRFPDRVAGYVDHRSQLTYNDGRDGESFADSLMRAVERFVEELIRAFDTHGPARFKKPR